MGVKSPKTKIKNREKNTSLIVDNNLDAAKNIPNIEFVSPALNNSNISQGDDNNGGTLSCLQQRIKLSRSLKALKSSTKRRQISKDIKQSIEQVGYLQHNLPSAVNLGQGDLRLFSIYGVPPSNNIVFSKKPKQKSKKRRDPSSILHN